MIGHGRVVEDDLFGIVARLKSIDSSYFVVENYKRKRLELHSKAQRGNTLTLVLPFSALDERTVERVLFTRVERRESLIKELERDEAANGKAELERVVKTAQREMEKCLK